ncbi:MAG: hypothetical protein AAGF31_00695 [Planctomycetota bacterium]
MATNSTGIDEALHRAQQHYDDLNKRMRTAPASARDEWRALQDRWTRFCEECARAVAADDKRTLLSDQALGLVAEEFEKAFRRIAEECASFADGSASGAP